MLDKDETLFFTEVRQSFFYFGGENKFGEESQTKLGVVTNCFFGV